MTIVPATEKDRQWAARLMSESDPWITLGRGFDDCLKACADPGCELFIAGAAGRPCGFVLLHPHGVAGSPYIRSVAVAPEFRRAGVGSRLLEFAELRYCGNARYIFLCVSSFNPQARSLYERCGYTIVGELADFIMDGATEILMYKRLVQQ